MKTRGLVKWGLATVAIVLALTVQVGSAHAQSFAVVSNFTDRDSVKVIVYQDGQQTNQLTLAKNTGAAAFYVTGKQSLKLVISGAPHSGSVTHAIQGVNKGYQGMILQITENGFVNFWRAHKAEENLKIK